MIGLLLVIVFTALPFDVYALTDFDLKESDGYRKKMYASFI